MPSTRKKPTLKLDRFNERAQAEFTPVSEGDNNQNQYFLALDEIADRPSGDTRLLNFNHINALAESLLVLGLITPLTVDRKGHLLAGGHRRAALIKISIEHPKRFAELFPQGIPVHVMDLDAQTDEVDALQIEVEENTQRRNFTAAEIREAAKRLENAGYTKLRGRPRPGQKSLKRELATVFRLSEDRIQRILNESIQKGRRTPTFSPEHAIEILERWLNEIGEPYESPDLMKATKQMQTLVKQLHRCRE